MSTVPLETFSSARFPGANPSLKPFVNVKAPRPRYAFSCRSSLSAQATGLLDVQSGACDESGGDLESGQSVLFLSSSFGKPLECFPPTKDSPSSRPPLSIRSPISYASYIPGYALPLPPQACLLSLPCINSEFQLDPSSLERISKAVDPLLVHATVARINFMLNKHRRFFRIFSALFVLNVLAAAAFCIYRFRHFIMDHVLYVSLFGGALAVVCLFFYGLLRILFRNVTLKWLKEIVELESVSNYRSSGVMLVLQRSMGTPHLIFVELGKGSSFKPYVKPLKSKFSESK